MENVKEKGFITKDEFLKIGMWKSPLPKKLYLSNSEQEIKSISKEVLLTDFEKRKIELLVSLKGVGIPVASAILTLIDPKNYGVIDIRVWQTLFLYGAVNVKPTGRNLNFNNWYNYLMKLRYYAQKFNVNARTIEQTLFWYHRKIHEGNLYSTGS